MAARVGIFNVRADVDACNSTRGLHGAMEGGEVVEGRRGVEAVEGRRGGNVTEGRRGRCSGKEQEKE